MAGLPGSGKSALAEAVARELGCALLSVDPIEAAMWRSGIARSQPTGLAAYVVAEDLAREQLLVGNDAIIDAVNDVPEAREQWVALAAEVGVPLAFVEVHCSDPSVHERRLRERRRGLVGFPEPTWESVRARQAGLDSWSDRRLRLDSMRPLSDILGEALDHLRDLRRAASEGP